MIENVHIPFAAMPPPVSCMPGLPPEPDNAAAEVPFHALNVPPQGNAGLNAGGFAVTSPTGNKSSNVKAVSATPLLLVMTKLIVAVPLMGMVGAENDLVMVGLMVNVIVAAAVVPVPPLVEDTVPVVLV